MTKQWLYHQDTPHSANWLIGQNLFRDGIPLRNLAKPSTVQRFSAKPYPEHLVDFDYGERPHFNSVVLSRCFYLIASDIGNPSWDQAGHIWFEALGHEAMKGVAKIRNFVNATCLVAERYNLQNIVAKNWQRIGFTKE